MSRCIQQDLSFTIGGSKKRGCCCSNRNISLFHYRNHGADFGRVLVGMQVPPEDEINFEVFLNQLGYPFWDETDNPAYKLFLG